MAARTIVVTGGGSGIGRAVARSFAADGDTVVITGRRRERLERAVAEIGPSVRAIDFDASDPAAVQAAAEDLPERVDVLVNAAGGNTGFDQPTPALDDLAGIAAAWRANFEANVLSAVLMTTVLTPRFVDGARIVTIGSIAAHQGSGSYGAAKAAIEVWTVDIAGRLGPRAITANVVAPGLTEGTEFFRDSLTDARRQRLINATKNGRAGRTADVTAAVRFLASPEAGHVTAQVLHVNGGAYVGR